MNKLLAIIKKEFLLLWRDKVGLLVLFALPTALVLFISLIQPSGSLKSQHVQVLLVDQDQGHIGRAVRLGLQKIPLFKVHNISSRNKSTLSVGKNQILSGERQVLIIVPQHSSHLSNAYLRDLNNPKLKEIPLVSPIHMFLDATLPLAMVQQIKISVQMMLQKIQLKTLTAMIREQARAPSLNGKQKDFFITNTEYISKNNNKKASPAQQNVPAWSLFGMFFIVIPLASVMIRERTHGIGQRLFLAPVSTFVLFLGRFIAYSAVNLIQLFFMLMVGVFILPLFGLETLNLWSNVFPVLVTGVCAAAAATGFGVFLGAILRTQQQASFLGPFIVVIAAAIGGIFVPMEMMPKVLLEVVKYSPLHWAQTAFLNIFVRGSSLYSPAVYKQLAKLLAFSAGCIFIGTILGRIRKPQTRMGME